MLYDTGTFAGGLYGKKRALSRKKKRTLVHCAREADEPRSLGLVGLMGLLHDPRLKWLCLRGTGGHNTTR